MWRSRTIIFFLIFGVIFTLLSIPFITGMMHPTFSEKNPYALFYAFCNLPVTMLFGGAITSFAEAVWGSPTLDQRDIMEFFVSLAFWSLWGAIIGWINDMKGGKV